MSTASRLVLRTRLWSYAREAFRHQPIDEHQPQDGDQISNEESFPKIHRLRNTPIGHASRKTQRKDSDDSPHVCFYLSNLRARCSVWCSRGTNESRRPSFRIS